MPRRYIKRRRFKRKRTFRRKRKRVRRNKFQMQVMRGPSYMPDKLLTTMKFVTHQTMLFSAQSDKFIAIAGNDIYSPLSSISTQQAVGFAELGGIYERFQVLGSRIIITVSNPGTTPFYFAVQPSTIQSLTTVTALDLAGNPYAKLITLAPNGCGGNTKTVRNYAKTDLVVGYDKDQTLNLWGSISSSPSLEWVWNMVGSFPVATDATIHLSINMLYYVRWSRKVLEDQSG